MTTPTTTITSDTVRINFDEYVQDSLVIRINYTNPDGTPIDLTGYTVDMEIRLTENDALPLLTFSSSAAQILLDGLDENIVIPISDQQTIALGKGIFSYFIRLVDTLGFVNTLVVGKITLRQRG